MAAPPGRCSLPASQTCRLREVECCVPATGEQAGSLGLHSRLSEALARTFCSGQGL